MTTETRDSLGNVVSRTSPPHPDFPSGGAGMPSGAVPMQHRLSPELVPSLDDRELARGARYLKEDRESFSKEIRDYGNRNPHLAPQQVARDVMKRRQQIEAANDPKERELVLALNDPKRKREVMDRIRHGLPAFPENGR